MKTNNKYMDRIITLKHATGEHTLKIPENDFEKSKELILQCIKGEMNVLTAKAEDGSERYFPSEFIRNSLITFDSSDLEKQLLAQKI